MRNRLRWYLVPVAGILIFITREAVAQTEFDTRWNVSEGLWSENANWVFENGDVAEPPSIVFDESAFIGNGGTAIVDSSVPDFVKLSIPDGTVLIQQGGSLKAVDTNTQGASGPSVVGGNGTLRLSGNGSLSTVDLENSGVIELNSVGSNFNVTGDLNHRGTLALNITSAGTSKVTMGGAAALAGTIAANFDNSLNLSFGDSFEFLSGASSVANNGARVVIPDSVVLDVGLDIQLTNTNSTASLVVSNLPVLSVNRANGDAAIRNVVGGSVTVTGYSIGSASGLLNPANWNSLADQQLEGWTEANPREQRLAELNLTSESTLEVGSSLNLGNAYNAALGAHPNDEDVTFEFSTPDDQVLSGLVEFTGPANDLVLRVDPDTGDGAIQNLSQFIDPFDITVYSIFSESGALSVADWTSLEDAGTEGWAEANPRADAIAELNLTGSQLFGIGQSISLGKPFTPGSTRDLVFEFGTVDGQLRFGTVEYGELGPIDLPGDCNGDGVINAADLACVATIPDRDIVLGVLNTLPGDLDGNGDVAFPDFLVLSANFGDPTKTSYTEGNIDLTNGVAFPDFLVLSANFGQTPAAGATAAAVPEPSSLLLFSVGASYLLWRRRRQIQ